MWFSNDDEVDDGENMVPMSDVLKNKIDADFDQINRLLENRRGTHGQHSKKKIKRLLKYLPYNSITGSAQA